MAALCKPYPSQVIATIMGAPVEDADRLWDWSTWIQRQFGMDVANERPRIEQAVTEFYAYADALLDRRRAEPGDDLISGLLTDTGPHAPMSRKDLLITAALLLVADRGRGCQVKNRRTLAPEQRALIRCGQKSAAPVLGAAQHLARIR